MKKKVSLFLVSILVVSLLIGCSNTQSTGSTEGKADRQFLTFAAPPASSALYPYWVSVGKAVSTAYPEYQITVSESQGAVDIAKRVRSGDVILGNCVSSTDYENYTGTGVFDGEPNEEFRILWYYETTPEQIIVSKNSGIKTVYDLEGKAFNPGGTGTSAASIALSIFDLLEIEPDYFEAGQSDASDAYANRQIDGTIKLGPYPDSYVMQLSAALPIEILSFSDEDIDKIITEYPYLIAVTIPAGTYEDIDYDVQTVATLQGAQTTTALSQEDGYKMIKAMWEGGKEVWQSAYPQGADANILELTLQSSLPLHAGAVQYLEEQGYEVPDELIPPEYEKR